VAESAALRRRLTAELRRLRAQANLTQRQVADRLDWSPSKVIRIEQGSVRVQVTDLEALLRLYGVSDTDAVAELTAMARESKKLPFTDYRDIVSAEAVTYFQYEANASIIRQVALNQIPGLLQTEEYARALSNAYGIDGKHADRLWESRKERRELFERVDPPETFFIVDESALRRVVGGIQTMGRQIDHLVAMSQRVDVSIQVLQFSLGAHSALAGPFILLEFPAENDPDVIFIETTLGDTLYRDHPQITARYRQQFWALEEVATQREDFEKIARI
jgi:transcriptional regulator with XRE-family HTH domain